MSTIFTRLLPHINKINDEDIIIKILNKIYPSDITINIIKYLSKNNICRKCKIKKNCNSVFCQSCQILLLPYIGNIDN